MPKYIKSHSNYVLKSKHQAINDGTIYERDITTIGALNQYAKGQVPIYRSGNFIITVRDDGRASNQYNTSKWEENELSGETWTLESLSGMVSDYEDQDDTKIVIKQDYYDLRDFAYYGSLTELFRASVTDIVDRFPGELYVTNDEAYYTSSVTIDFDTIEDSVRLGDGVEVSNPFGIDIFSKIRPNDAKILRYFADEGYKNYEIDGNEITTYSVTYEDPCYNEKISANTFAAGSKIATVTLNGALVIEVWMGDGHEIVYLTSDDNVGMHIRPKEPFMAEFYNGCDNFQKLLMNKDTDYTATFSVIHEDKNGYYRSFEELQFPKGDGGYNIDASDYGFNDYTAKMVEIGEFYDERFTDNLWRSMTHEAIKNFDWTYTREYGEGDEEEYVFGGQRMQKALRIFARQFDDTITFIDNIKSVNRITYDERGNLPDYFLTDAVENSGWSVKLIYPYSLTEHDEDGNTVIDSGYTLNQVRNIEDGKRITREFSQNSTDTFNPYSYSMIKDGTDGGYFIMCCTDAQEEVTVGVDSNIGNCGGLATWQWNVTTDTTHDVKIKTPDNYSGTSSYTFVKADGRSTLYDECALGGKGAIKYRIKSYTDEKKWTNYEANNEFLRRLKINSPYIWRHKGTIEGVEMILGMFGMKSKRWAEKNHSEAWDYEIKEYSSFANRIEEPWDAVHQKYRINWINSTKNIIYDNRSTSNYSSEYGIGDYQGILVSYRDEYVNMDTSGTAYVGKTSLESQITDGINGVSSAECFVMSDGTPVVRRYLYPTFEKSEALDGNPYFQMDGGWLRKTLANEEGKTEYNFQYDVDDNIVSSGFIKSGYTNSTGDIIDNKPLFKETVRNIRRVDNVSELLSIPTINLHNGVICHVTRIETNSAVIDGIVYDITEEWYDDHVVSYVTFTKDNGYIKVGKNKFFDTTLIVYNADGEENIYNVEEIDDGMVVNAYIINGNFICKEDEDGNYSISSFQILANNNSSFTNYFVLDDINYADELSTYDASLNGYTSGWRRIKRDSEEFSKINIIINDSSGNNPHNGNMVYDCGHDYFTYFKRLFKYSVDNDLFDERCYEDYYYSLDTEISNYGFSGLIDDNESILQYDTFLTEDTKIHYFGNYKTKKSEDNHIDNVWIYGDDVNRMVGGLDKRGGFDVIYGSNLGWYNLSANNSEGWIENYNPYSAHTDADEVTNQIVNNKRMLIKFKLHNTYYSHDGQCEIKYIDDVVMNYLTQMIPSTTILDIEYQSQPPITEVSDNPQMTVSVNDTETVTRTITEQGIVPQFCVVGDNSQIHSSSRSYVKYCNGVPSTVQQGITEICEDCTCVICNCDALEFTEVECPTHSCGCDKLQYEEVAPPSSCGCNNLTYSEIAPPTNCGCKNIGYEEVTPPTNCGCKNISYTEIAPPTPCGCNDLTYTEIAPPTDCGCKNINYTEIEPPTDCGCKDLVYTEITPPTPCGCDNLAYTDVTPTINCGCNNLRYVDITPHPTCDCDSLDYQLISCD